MYFSQDAFERLRLTTDLVLVVVEPLLVGRLLGDALDHLLQLGHRRVLLGVQEHGRLLPADHQEHVHRGGGGGEPGEDRRELVKYGGTLLESYSVWFIRVGQS